MRLGIDFGTTRVVVAAADRGNYPVIQFESLEGEIRDWFPPLVAARGGERRYGWQAWALQAEPGWTVVRSLKRILADAGLDTEIQFDSGSAPLRTILQEMTAALREDLLDRSNLPDPRGKLEIELGVPANANTNQRFLTAEAFRLGGFEVLGLLNEPSAASLEYSHHHPAGRAEERRYVLVYDLGGGTFDASLVALTGPEHEVLGSEGLSSLGGDDFDDILAEMALETVGLDETERDSLSQSEWFRLREECRRRKESVHPNSRKIPIDLDQVRQGWSAVAVSVDEFYERCLPAVEETLHALDDALARNGFSREGLREDGSRIETVYVAGGGSELPLVPRALRERFGRRVKRSAHGRSSTAIGLAVQADAAKGYVLRDRFTRYFGVYRESQGGREATFDPLFARDTPLPTAKEPPLTVVRGYSPAHNVGHFRYLECSRLAEDGRPAGDITIWDDILFAFDPALASAADLPSVRVERSDAAPTQWIEETYTCDAAGRLEVAIANRTAGYEARYRLGRWAASATAIRPGRRAAPKPRRPKASGSAGR